MYSIKITGFDGYPAEREWFNWKDFHSLLVVLDKAQSSNLAFRMSVTRKWGIPKAHYMPVRGVTEDCAPFDNSLKTFQTHFPPLNMVWTYLDLNVIKIHYNRFIMYSMYRQKDELPDYDGQSSLFGVKRKMQQCTKDHLLSLWCIPLFICWPPIFSIWHSIYFILIWRNVSHTLLTATFRPFKWNLSLYFDKKPQSRQPLPRSVLLFIYDFACVQHACVPQ